MQDEISEIKGRKPIVLKSSQSEDLVNFLKISSGCQNQVLKSSPSVVILVRNQQEKALLPASLNSMLCLTVKESKGLEFDTVILYNYFGHNSSCWKYLDQLSINIDNLSVK